MHWRGADGGSGDRTGRGVAVQTGADGGEVAVGNGDARAVDGVGPGADGVVGVVADSVARATGDGAGRSSA
jgi:hypothetical protein